ncbi:Uncharacterized protein Fot_07026 [Forsythia ovata]|uniref:Uncharacterized protein n=1 Tax=Forsythia ovata TaxID=205694 RepID=A0ABD1WUM8_9LAMI
MLPTSSSTKGRSGSYARPNYFLPQYLRRIVEWQQMDIEYTFCQMLHLCTSPKVVYKHTKFHKQTKNQWAHDDPAFLVICSLLLAVSTIAYCAAYDHSAGHAVFVVISVLLFHFLITGAILATFCWFFTNNYLREEAPNSHVVEQRVEWLYAFDVHCNSFFPIDNNRYGQLRLSDFGLCKPFFSIDTLHEDFSVGEESFNGTSREKSYALMQDHERAFFDLADWALSKVREFIHKFGCSIEGNV